MKNTTDIWFAAYLQLRGIKVEKFEIISRGKGRYFFNLTESEWQDHKLAFNNNTELGRYKAIIEQLKDLLY